MTYHLEISPLAAAEIIDAFDWYEVQKDGLGVEFLNELERFFDQLLMNPFTYSFYTEPVRSGKLDRFPYIVVYEAVGTAIIIYSVFMTRRDSTFKGG